METFFASLHQLAVANAKLREKNAANEAEQTFQWYVSKIDSFIVSVDIKKLRDTFSTFDVTEASKTNLENWLNDFTLIWNRWRGDIHVGFREVGLRASESADNMNKLFDRTITILTELIKTPQDDVLRSQLISHLHSFERQIEYISEELLKLIKNLKAFIDSFDEQEKIFVKICNQTYSEKGLKEEDINKIKKLIKEYKDNIKNTENSIIALGVVDGLGVLGTVAGIVGAFFTGGLTLSLLVPCLPIIGCTSYMIDKYRKEIAQLRDKIKEKEEEIEDLNDDIEGLVAFSETINSISEKDSSIEDYVRKAKEPWDALAQDISDISDNISSVDVTKETYTKYIDAFNTAKSIWINEFMPGINALKLPDSKVINTPEGFIINTPEDWEEAIKKFSVSIDEYFRLKSA